MFSHPHSRLLPYAAALPCRAVARRRRRVDLLTMVDANAFGRRHKHYHSTGGGHVYQNRCKAFAVADDDHLLTVIPVDRPLRECRRDGRESKQPQGVSRYTLLVGGEAPNHLFGHEKNRIMLKAFVVCNNITDNPSNPDQKDLRGAGLSRIDGAAPFPVKLTFWVFVQSSDQKETGPRGWRSCGPIRADVILPPNQHPPCQHSTGDRFLHSLV